MAQAANQSQVYIPGRIDPNGSGFRPYIDEPLQGMSRDQWYSMCPLDRMTAEAEVLRQVTELYGRMPAAQAARIARTDPAFAPKAPSGGTGLGALRQSKEDAEFRQMQQELKSLRVKIMLPNIGLAVLMAVCMFIAVLCSLLAWTGSDGPALMWNSLKVAGGLWGAVLIARGYWKMHRYIGALIFLLVIVPVGVMFLLNVFGGVLAQVVTWLEIAGLVLMGIEVVPAALVGREARVLLYTTVACIAVLAITSWNADAVRTWLQSLSPEMARAFRPM